MKRLFILLCVLTTLTSCFNDVKKEMEANEYVNKWIYEYMSALYYWTDELPPYKSSYNDPQIYFKSLINEEDRFSAIFDDYQEIMNKLNGVTASDVGFEFDLFLESNANNNVIGIVVYVKPGTTASTMGIKRGDMFRKINGKQITVSNYSDLINTFYDASSKVTVTFSEYNGSTFIDHTPSSITKTLNYKEDPVYLDTIYSIQDKKIGYLVYNFFTTDSGDETMQYDLEMNNTIGRFNQANITDLVIDLRYNSGGMQTSAIHMASMLVPNLTANKVLTYTEYNQNYTDYFNSNEFKQQYDVNPFVDNFATAIKVATPSNHSYPVQNVGDRLQRIYFLTGRSTASASEMVINGLKPYINCVLIGDTTVGKNVGSTLVYDEENTKKNKWAMMPIILKYFNKDHQSDFTNGFAPDFLLNDDYKHSLGDMSEALLAKAVSEITGVQQNTRVKGLPTISYPIRGKSLLDKQRGLVVSTRFK